LTTAPTACSAKPLNMAPIIFRLVNDEKQIEAIKDAAPSFKRTICIPAWLLELLYEILEDRALSLHPNDTITVDQYDSYSVVYTKKDLTEIMEDIDSVLVQNATK
jgi:hypothetical protein